MYQRNSEPVVVSTVHLAPATHATLKDVCRANGWSLRWFLATAIREKLARLSAAGV